MEGKFFIDGVDAFTEFGLFVEKGGYRELIQMPSFKSLDSTEWAEYNGAEVNLNAPALNSRSINIPLCITDINNAEYLFNCLADGSYHYFRFEDIGTMYKLRLSNNGSFVQGKNIGKISATFSDDFPFKPSTDVIPENVEVNQDSYFLDSVNFSTYGIWVLNGTDANIRKCPNVRENLKTESKYKNGVIYDADYVRFKPKDVSFNLLIHADSISDFWLRWDAFFCQLLRPNMHHFFFEKTNLEYECYYKNNSVSRFELLGNGHVWCEFSVVLVFLDSSSNRTYSLLSSESDEFITTENNRFVEVYQKTRGVSADGIQRVRISDLPYSEDLDGLYTLGTASNDTSVRVPIGELLKKKAGKDEITDLLAKVSKEVEDRKTSINTIKDAVNEEKVRATAEEQRLEEAKAERSFITDSMINSLE